MSSGQSDTSEPARPRLFAVRHAPTLARGLCVGDAEVDCSISAEQAAGRINTVVPDCRFASVWSSPRARCLQPARVLAEQLALPLQVDGRLREIGLGVWQGRPWSAIEAGDSARFHDWLSNWTDSAPPEGETAANLLLRVRSWWTELPSGCHLLVAHAGVIRGLRVLVHGDSWPQAMSEPVPYLQGQWFSLTPSDGRRA
jgi:alpha-ribazole phosphatase